MWSDSVVLRCLPSVSDAEDLLTLSLATVPESGPLLVVCAALCGGWRELVSVGDTLVSTAVEESGISNGEEQYGGKGASSFMD